jgi:hypothetical protein
MSSGPFDITILWRYNDYSEDQAADKVCTAKLGASNGNIPVREVCTLEIKNGPESMNRTVRMEFVGLQNRLWFPTWVRGHYRHGLLNHCDPIFVTLKTLLGPAKNFVLRQHSKGVLRW